jgi:hypothetical protein
MDQSLEARGWRRGFAAGFLALALSVGGQMASGNESASCASAAQPGLAEQVIAQLKPSVRIHGGMAQRVALAVLGAVLHSACS